MQSLARCVAREDAPGGDGAGAEGGVQGGEGAAVAVWDGPTGVVYPGWRGPGGVVRRPHPAHGKRWRGGPAGDVK